MTRKGERQEQLNLRCFHRPPRPVNAASCSPPKSPQVPLLSRSKSETTPPLSRTLPSPPNISVVPVRPPDIQGRLPTLQSDLPGPADSDVKPRIVELDGEGADFVSEVTPSLGASKRCFDEGPGTVIETFRRRSPSPGVPWSLLSPPLEDSPLYFSAYPTPDLYHEAQFIYSSGTLGHRMNGVGRERVFDIRAHISGGTARDWEEANQFESVVSSGRL